MTPFHDAVFACAVALARGDILSACDVTAGNGTVIDWRTAKSGDVRLQGGTWFDVASMFVILVGEDAALACAKEAA